MVYIICSWSKTTRVINTAMETTSDLVRPLHCTLTERKDDYGQSSCHTLLTYAAPPSHIYITMRNAYDAKA